MNTRIMLFIPAYRTQDVICGVIDRIPKKTMDRITEIVVIDNASPDQTFKVISDYKKRKNLRKLTVLRNKKNLFFGGNVKAGLRYAVGKKMDIMAILHSDGQYPSEMIDELIAPIEKGEADTVFGSRFLVDPLKGGMPYWRYFGNIFLTALENFLVGCRYSEWHSGYVAYRISAIKGLPIERCDNGYELTTDLLLLFISHGYRVAEIPIPTHYGAESTSPTLKRTFTYFINSFKLSLIYFLHKAGILNLRGKYGRMHRGKHVVCRK